MQQSGLGKAGPLLSLSMTVMPTQVSAQIPTSLEERLARGSRNEAGAP